MKIGLLMLILSLTTVFTHADNKDSTVDLTPQWKKGDILQYTMIRTRLKSQAETTISKSKSTTPVNIEIIEADDNGYLLSWTMGETVFEDLKQASDPLVRMMINITKDFNILLKLDRYATITQVKNWKDLQKASFDTIQTLARSMKDAGMDNATIETIRKQLESMCATREQIEQLCTREPQMFFLTLGRSYPLSTSIDYQDRLPNPFGGDPFPSRASFILEKVDAGSDIAVVTWKQEIDPVAGAQVLEKTLRELAKRMGHTIPEGQNLDLLGITDIATFTHHLSSGWPQQISHTRTIKIEDGSQVDSLSFIQEMDGWPL